MTIEVRVPTLPESVSDATVLAWHKQPGESVSRDENLVDLETDKVVLEVPAPADGVLQSRAVAAGELAVLSRPEAGVHDRTANTGPCRSPGDVVCADAATALVAAPTAADRTVEIVRVTEAQGVAEFVGNHVLGSVGSIGGDAGPDVDVWVWTTARGETRRAATA